jgi:glycosyltransferase involved in cell wall biosynthesis/GT2 family glycosyltransferase
MKEGKQDVRPESRLSIAICAFNGVEYTKLLIDSIRRHSQYEHEILIFSDGSTDGTLEWLRKQKDLVWQHDRRNRGICTAMNRAAAMATRDFLFFPNTDHVVGPGWDRALLARLRSDTVVSCQCIEPGIVPVAPIFHTADCGTRWDLFDESAYHDALARLVKASESPGINYPFALPRALWEEVGGLDEVFNPGPANDPDLFYRLNFAGARMVRAEDVVVYHFSGKSSRMAGETRHERPEWSAITDRNEGRFVDKWGERYKYSNGGLPDPGPEARRRWEARRPAAPTVSVRTRLQVAFDARGITPRAGGIGVYAKNLVRALSRLKEGPILHCLSQDPEGLRAQIGDSDGIVIEKVLTPVADPRADSMEVLAHLERIRPQVFHGPAFSLPRGLRVPGIVTVHDLAFLKFPQWYPAEFVRHLSEILEESVRSAAQIIVPSDRTREDVLHRFKTDSPSVTRVYEALPEEFATKPSPGDVDIARKKYAGGHPFVLSVGVQQRRKNAMGLLQAFKRLTQELDHPLRLVLVGGQECEDDRLSKEIPKLGLESRVTLTSQLSTSDIVSLYAGCTVFAYPSFYEGFGLPPLEAMAHDAPVICSNGGALPEVVGEAAKLFSPDSEESIVSALRDVITNNALRQELIERGRKQVSRFSWDAAAQETLAIYERATRDSISVNSDTSRPQTAAVPSQSEPRKVGVASAAHARIAIDARLWGFDHLGTGRYTREILSALWKQCDGAEFVLIGPQAVPESQLPEGVSILQHVPVGPETLLDPSWEQYSLPTHLLGCDLLFSPTGIIPIARPCKAIPVIHDLGFIDHPEHYDPVLQAHLNRWIKNSCLSADMIIAVSEFTRDRVSQVFKVSTDRIRVVHHGHPVNGLPRKTTASDSPNGYILSVSSFEPNKNLPALLQAFVRLSKEWPGDLILAGRPGRDLPRLEKMIQEHSLQDRVKLVVGADDARVRDLYGSATLFVFPSLYEGFGLPLLEAMALGIPVVASKLTSCPEVVGEGGVLVDEPTPEALGDAIGSVLMDRPRMEKLSAAAIERANHFSWSKAGAETWSAFTTCLEAR